MFADLLVSIIVVAIVTTVVTRPGASQTISVVTGYVSNAIKALLGTE